MARHICWLFIILVFIVIVVQTLVWSMPRPNFFEVHVVNASASQFNLTSNNILEFNLSLVINVTNLNKKGGTYKGWREARAFYEDKKFGSVKLIPFFQMNTTILRPLFHGQASVHFGNSESSNFNRDKSAGSFDIEVKLYGDNGYGKNMDDVECDFKVPLVSNGSMLVSRFRTTKCKFVNELHRRCD